MILCKYISGYLFLLVILLSSCGSTDKKELQQTRNLTKDFQDYWYTGEAEIISYKLEQSRYGEPREGSAVLIFVTEDFLKEQQVKANKKGPNSTSVLKLNAVKKFNTGIYPYSIMESTFYPLEKVDHALKISATIQEWCGHVYMQLNNREKFEVDAHSYFQGEADNKLSFEKAYLENELWTQLRIDPQGLPTGEIQIFPSMEYVRLAHKDFKAYNATAEFYEKGSLTVYKIEYPDLKRDLKIYFHNTFPFKIEKWEESIQQNGKEQVTSAIKTAEIKSAYWSQNSNKDLPLRENLNLN